MTTIRTHLPVERAYQYIEELQSATPGMLELARCFQRLAFPGKIFTDGFVPAPLYLMQALALTSNKERWREFAICYMNSGT